MRITKSPLELIDFFLLDSQYRYISTEETDVSAETWFDQYEVDMDYMFQPEKDTKNEIWVYVRTAVNCSSEPLPGYRVFIEGTGHFKAIDQEGVSPEEWDKLLNSSALAIVINNLRAGIMQLTAHGPFGKYILPSVDLVDLHRQKQAAFEATLPKKRRAKKKELASGGEDV